MSRSCRISERRDPLSTQRGQVRHQILETALLQRKAPLLAPIESDSTRGILLAVGSVPQRGASAKHRHETKIGTSPLRERPISLVLNYFFFSEICNLLAPIHCG